MEKVGRAQRRMVEISTRGCEEAFGGRGRAESVVCLRSDGGCEMIPDRTATVCPLLLSFSPSFPVSPYKIKGHRGFAES